MKLVYIVLMAVGLTSLVQADALSSAYKKEYAFLKAQKDELTQRLKKEKAQQDATLQKASEEVARLRKRLIEIDETLKAKQKLLASLKEKLSDKQANGDIVANVLMQAKSSLETYGTAVVEQNKTDESVFTEIFDKTLSLYQKLSSVRKEKGRFFLVDGTQVKGTIVKVGNIAAYGMAPQGKGALAPAGNGAYKLWNQSGSEDDAQAFLKGQKVDPIDIFLYENLDKEVEYKKEKTLKDTLKAGGVIGYIIFGLGALGVVLLILRAVYLMRSGSNVEKITSIVVDKLQEGRAQEALDAIKKYNGSTARVIKATLRNITRDREHIEDIITENILNESSQIDRYGNFVLVIAAVAPLLGLLGTVTGMIATFDIITEYGTGDPKLLSGGISEALVTTMQGLIVAIPLLLFGNLLSGWARKIKDSMEQSALHIVNVYEKYKARA